MDLFDLLSDECCKTHFGPEGPVEPNTKAVLGWFVEFSRKFLGANMRGYLATSMGGLGIVLHVKNSGNDDDVLIVPLVRGVGDEMEPARTDVPIIGSRRVEQRADPGIPIL